MDDIIQLESYMRHAIREAEESLREGNKGFGAVIIKDGEIIASAHDGEETESDPTSHAEINAIKLAGKKIGKDLSGCLLLTTSEPCPMCAFAIAWSGIKEIAFGYSIQDALAQGRGGFYSSVLKRLIKQEWILPYIKVFFSENAQLFIARMFEMKSIDYVRRPMTILGR